MNECQSSVTSLIYKQKKFALLLYSHIKFVICDGPTTHPRYKIYFLPAQINLDNIILQSREPG
jgi:hypothetical protein